MANRVRRIIPILRIFSEEKAREFYVDYLGSRIDWEHRFEPNSPLYMQVSRDGLVLHLSEHYGDALPVLIFTLNTTVPGNCLPNSRERLTSI